MFFFLSLFTLYTKIAPITIQLSNGQQILATHSSIVKLNEALILNNVLYMPSFTFNLVSVSKLVSSLNCTLIFCASKFLIHDNSKRMMIGMVDVEGRLHKFKSKIQYNFVAYPSIAVISCGIIGLAIPLMIGCFFSSNNILF